MSYAGLAPLVCKKTNTAPSGRFADALTAHRHTGVILVGSARWPAPTVAPPNAAAISPCLSVLQGSFALAAPAGVTETANARARTTTPTMMRLFMHPPFLVSRQIVDLDASCKSTQGAGVRLRELLEPHAEQGEDRQHLARHRLTNSAVLNLNQESVG